MSLRIVVDMNLSVEWIPLLEQAGWTAVHWSAIGDPRAEDVTITAWASANKHVVFTHDLDFGTALALTHAGEPSVIQVRAQSVGCVLARTRIGRTLDVPCVGASTHPTCYCRPDHATPLRWD